MDSSVNSNVKCECVVCGLVSERSPVYYCPRKHPYSQTCCRELKFASKGNESQLICTMCKFAGEFQEARLSPELRNVMNLRPGIGRPYRYNINTMLGTNYNYSKNYQDFCTPSSSATKHDEEQMFETLIGMTKKNFYKCQATYKQESRNENKTTALKSISYHIEAKPNFSHYSKKPFKCPHKPCHRTVALSQFVSHFKSEHKDVQTFSVERGKELFLPLDISVVEHGSHFCLAMITVYEINRIDFSRSGSSDSIARTCNKFCQKVPINTFWLMVTGSSERKLNISYCLFWLFTNSEDCHKCTIELSSRNDLVSLSTYCGILTATDKDFSNVEKKLRCLIVTKSSLLTLLKEGALLNLRVIIH